MSPLGLNIVQCLICDNFHRKYGLSVGSQLKLLTEMYGNEHEVMKVNRSLSIMIVVGENHECFSIGL